MASAGRASVSGAWSGRREAGAGQHARSCDQGLLWRHGLEHLRPVVCGTSRWRSTSIFDSVCLDRDAT